MSTRSFRAMMHDECRSEFVTFEAAMRYVRQYLISDDIEENREIRILKVETSLVWEHCQGCEDC